MSTTATGTNASALAEFDRTTSRWGQLTMKIGRASCRERVF